MIFVSSTSTSTDEASNNVFNGKIYERLLSILNLSMSVDSMTSSLLCVETKNELASRNGIDATRNTKHGRSLGTEIENKVINLCPK
jgi:hypothetical protein